MALVDDVQTLVLLLPSVSCRAVSLAVLEVASSRQTSRNAAICKCVCEQVSDIPANVCSSRAKKQSSAPDGGDKLCHIEAVVEMAGRLVGARSPLLTRSGVSLVARFKGAGGEKIRAGLLSE